MQLLTRNLSNAPGDWRLRHDDIRPQPVATEDKEAVFAAGTIPLVPNGFAGHDQKLSLSAGRDEAARVARVMAELSDNTVLAAT